MGGLISVYLALSRPHLFSRVAGQSSALFFEEEKLTTLAARLSDSISFYFDVGEFEAQFIPAHRRLVALLESKGCRCQYRQVPGGHNWTTWRGHIKELLTFLWGQKAGIRTERDIKTELALESVIHDDSAPVRRN